MPLEEFTLIRTKTYDLGYSAPNSISKALLYSVEADLLSKTYRCYVAISYNLISFSCSICLDMFIPSGLVKIFHLVS